MTVARHDWAVWANVVGAVAASVVNLWAAVNGDVRLRGMRCAVSALAAFYVGGYVWLLATGDALTWSAFFRRVALIAWPLVWILPPLLGARAHRAAWRALGSLFDSEAS